MATKTNSSRRAKPDRSENGESAPDNSANDGDSSCEEKPDKQLTSGKFALPFLLLNLLLGVWSISHRKVPLQL